MTRSKALANVVSFIATTAHRSHPAYVTGVGAVMDTVVKFTAIDFLERLRPGGPWVLTAIVPDGPAGSTETITATSAAQVDAFILANDGKRNLYYSLNPTWKTLGN